MMIGLLLWGCGPQDVEKPFGGERNNSVVWGPVSFGTGSSSETDSGDTGSGDEGSDDAADDQNSSDLSDANIGFNTNDIAPNLSATSSSGMPWSLYGQDGMVLLLVGSADSMGLIRMLEQAEDLPKEAQHVLLLGNNVFAMPADSEDAALLRSSYPALDVVLLDPTLEQINTWAERAPPKAYLIDRNHQILWSGFQSLSTAQLSELLSSSP